MHPPQATSTNPISYDEAGAGAGAGAGLAMGGYFFPSFSTLGSQVQRSASGTLSKTAGMWFPHPFQEAFSVEGKYR